MTYIVEYEDRHGMRHFVELDELEDAVLYANERRRAGRVAHIKEKESPINARQ